jgi:hypothetical protein
MKLKLTCLLLCLASLSASGSDLASQLAACQKMSDENQRLACFDQISNPKSTVTAPVSLPPPAAVMAPVNPPAPAAPVAATPALPAAPAIERVTELPQKTVSPRTATTVTEKVNTEEFGAEQLKKPEAPAAAELSSKVVKIEKDARKRMILHLANGQQWLQLEVEYFYVKPGDTAIIRRAALSSFLLGTDRVSKTIRVRRVK